VLHAKKPNNKDRRETVRARRISNPFVGAGRLSIGSKPGARLGLTEKDMGTANERE